MGYTIYYHPQVTPKIIQVEVADEPRWVEPVYETPEPVITYDNDGNPIGDYVETEQVLVTPGHWGPETSHMEDRLNPAPPSVYPASFSRKIWACRSMDVYSADPKLRAELWEDSAGTASYAEIVSVFPELPGYAELAARSWGDRQLAGLATPYAGHERETWHVQQREAEAWLVDPSTPVPMIAALASSRGITLEDLVQKILGNVELFRRESGRILGLQQALIDRAYGAQTMDELLAVATAIGIDLMQV